jgi:hypothetical protein
MAAISSGIEIKASRNLTSRIALVLRSSISTLDSKVGGFWIWSGKGKVRGSAVNPRNSAAAAISNPGRTVNLR